jgi:hypothetical protein
MHRYASLRVDAIEPVQQYPVACAVTCIDFAVKSTVLVWAASVCAAAAPAEAANANASAVANFLIKRRSFARTEIIPA